MNKRGQEALLSNVVILIIFLVAVSVGGLLAGITYYNMNILQATLETVNFTLPIENMAQANSNLTDFQDILGIVVYPILNLKSALPYLTYFMVFGFIIALGITAYVSSRNPVFFTLHLLFTLLITYFCFKISNMYIELLTNPFINSLMTQFTIYNKLMIYLPQVVFFTSMVFGAISFINVIKPQSNFTSNQTSLNYGGDY